MGEQGWRQDAFFLLSEVIESIFFCLLLPLVHPAGLVLDSPSMLGCMLMLKQKALGFSPSSLADVLCCLAHVPFPPGPP